MQKHLKTYVARALWVMTVSAVVLLGRCDSEWRNTFKTRKEKWNCESQGENLTFPMHKEHKLNESSRSYEATVTPLPPPHQSPSTKTEFPPSCASFLPLCAFCFLLLNPDLKYNFPASGVSSVRTRRVGVWLGTLKTGTKCLHMVTHQSLWCQFTFRFQFMFY